MTLGENSAEANNKTTNKTITIVVVDDVEKYRNKIIELLPIELGTYQINFKSFSSYMETKQYIQHQYKNQIDENIFCVLDNNFYWYKNDQSVQPNAGVDIYKTLQRRLPQTVQKTAIFSSYQEQKLKKLYNNDNIKIIPGKEYGPSIYIKAIAEWIKEIVEIEEE